MRAFVVVLALGWALGSARLVASEVPGEGAEEGCKEIHLAKPLKVYKDPALYPSSPGLFDVEPGTGLEKSHEENPLLSSFTGTFRYQPKTKTPRAFRDFGLVARMYDLQDRPRTKAEPKRPRRFLDDYLVIQIQICGENEPYAGTLGLVFVKDLREAQVEDHTGGLPPSVYPNPIPRLQENPSAGTSSGAKRPSKKL